MRSNFDIVEITSDHVTIKDVGGKYNRSVTNDAENVVSALSNLIEGRRLFYYDSLGDLSELLHENGEFIGFASC